MKKALGLPRRHLPSKVLICLVLIPVFIFNFKTFRQRLTSFGCFDDCAIYSAGYFMTKGKTLYTDLPFNHQMLLPHLSYLIQTIFKPDGLYQLLLAHRLFLFFFSLVMDLLIAFRFGLIGAAFILFFEPTKYYLFGERFLSESFIVYPVVYSFGILWQKLMGRRISSVDYLLTGIFAWFVIFAREPYVPLAIFTYFLILWGRKIDMPRLFSLFIFLSLSLGMLLTVSIPDYLFNLITLNTASVATTEMRENILANWGILKVFGYPIFIFFGGRWNIFRLFLVTLSVAFLILLLITARKNKKLAVMVVFILGLANLRPVIPGTIFYEAFHIIQWYGLLLMTIFFMLASLYRKRKYLANTLTGLLFISLALLLFLPKSYVWDKVDRQTEFVTGYGSYLAPAEILRILADPKDTLFIDNNRRDLVYWQTNLASPYKYSWYTWVMPGIPRYDTARLEMFRDNAPDFYYGECQNGVSTMPPETANNYRHLYFAGRTTCLFVHTNKIKKISADKWQKAKGLQYYLP